MALTKQYTQKLEMDYLLNSLEQLAVTPLAQEYIRNLLPSNDIAFLNECLDEVDEAMKLVLRYDRAPIMIASNYQRILELAQKGALLSGLDLYETIRLYQTVRANERMMNNLIKERIAAPYYISKVQQLYLNNSLEDALIKSVDEEGNVLDSASSTLKRLRDAIRNIDARIKSKLQEIIGKEGSRLSQTVVSMRDDHYVIPVKAEHKNSFAGTIRDVSSSSQTVFIEPQAIVEMTMQKASLVNDCQKEINRILHALSLDVANESEILRSNFMIIVDLDVVFAKAVLAKSQQASRPHINDEHRFNLIDARHPLLNVPKVIPNNVSFGHGYLGIIITGPNTGGKTVLLKTVGLLAMMVKYGLLIPCDAHSDIMIFDQICCDIGDDQSIHDNLSTFSSHMQNIIGIIDTVTPNSLVLFDEIGAGTDPDEGSNLAIAVLNYLIAHQVSFVTTTHYSLLKAFAFDQPEVINASMKFDQDTLSPTYKLELGLPGASNAFNIAKRLGLKAEIIEDAQNRTLAAETDVKNLIAKLEKRGIELNLEYQTLQKEKEDVQELKHKLAQEWQDINNNRQLWRRKAEAEAEKIVAETTSKALKLLAEIQKRNNSDIKLHEVIAIKKELADLNPSSEVILESVAEQLAIGDDVYVPSYDQYGVITKLLKTGLYEVAIGNIKMKIEPQGLRKAKPTTAPLSPKSSFTQIKSKAHISLTLDLRGKRYEEAKDLLEKYFDDIMVANIKQCTIIHGYGTGAIREVVQQFLKNNPNIDSSRYGVAGEGGFGVTVVNLK